MAEGAGMRPTISGEIVIFDDNAKPVLSIIKNGAGEWLLEIFTQDGDTCEKRGIRHDVPKDLARFMDYHTMDAETMRASMANPEAVHNYQPGPAEIAAAKKAKADTDAGRPGIDREAFMEALRESSVGKR